jgi:hypothetical protein
LAIFDSTNNDVYALPWSSNTVCSGPRPSSRHAVWVVAREVLGVDQRLDLLEAEDGGVGVELAADHDEAAVRCHVAAVRALGLGHEEEQALGDGHLERDHPQPLDGTRLPLRHHLLRALPVDHVEVVHVVLGGARLERRPALQVAAVGALGVERVDEGPAVGDELARVRQVLHVWRHLDRERLLEDQAPLRPVELPEGLRAAVLLVVLLDRRVGSSERHWVLRALDHVLGVRRDEGGAVVGLEDRIGDDLHRREVLEIDHRHARVGLVADEEEFAVVIAIGLAQVRMMGVAPAHLHAAAIARRQHALGLVVARPPALPRLGREDGDVLEDAHARDAEHEDLPRLTARGEDVVVVLPPGRHVGLEGGRHVGVGEAPRLHQLRDAGAAARALGLERVALLGGAAGERERAGGGERAQSAHDRARESAEHGSSSRFGGGRGGRHGARPRTYSRKAVTTSGFPVRSGFAGMAALLPTAAPPYWRICSTC